MIESIHIKNFRGIQDGKIDRFSKINLLVGPNNSGKSAVLETIYLSNTASRAAILESGSWNHDATTSDLDLLGVDPLERICERHKKNLENTQNQGTISRHFEYSSSPGFALHLRGVAGKTGLFSWQGFALALKELDSDRKFILQLENKLFGFGDTMSDASDRMVYFWERSLTHYQKGESAWLVHGQIPVARNTLFYDVSTTLNHLPFEFFSQMINTVPGWTHKIANRFKSVFPSGKNFNVIFQQLNDDRSQTQGIIAPEDNIALTIDDYGDGARSAFKLLTPLIALSELSTAEKPGVLIWEEPELFQNPQSLGKLLAEVVELIKDKPIQLFIATHSIEVVAQFVRLVNEKAINAEDLLAIRLNLQDGQLSSSAFNYQDIQDWTAMHLDLRVPDGRVDSPLQFQLAEAANDGE